MGFGFGCHGFVTKNQKKFGAFLKARAQGFWIFSHVKQPCFQKPRHEINGKKVRIVVTGGQGQKSERGGVSFTEGVGVSIFPVRGYPPELKKIGLRNAPLLK